MKKTLLVVGLGLMIVLSGCATNSPSWGIFGSANHPYNPYENTAWIPGYWANDGMWVAGHWEYNG